MYRDDKINTIRAYLEGKTSKELETLETEIKSLQKTSLELVVLPGITLERYNMESMLSEIKEYKKTLEPKKPKRLSGWPFIGVLGLAIGTWVTASLDKREDTNDDNNAHKYQLDYGLTSFIQRDAENVREAYNQNRNLQNEIEPETRREFKFNEKYSLIGDGKDFFIEVYSERIPTSTPMHFRLSNERNICRYTVQDGGILTREAPQRKIYCRERLENLIAGKEQGYHLTSQPIFNKRR